MATASERYRREFPDFAPEYMPAIPEGFADESWHNDMCPRFINRELGRGIWVDFADPADREIFEGPRFIVTDEDTGDGATLLETDDWSEVEAFIEREAISYRLREDRLTRADAEVLLAEEFEPGVRPCPDMLSLLRGILA